MPRRPDRFERVANDTYQRWVNAVGDTAQWHTQDVAKLLRKEHRWVERVVKQAIASVENGIEPGAARNGYVMACNELLERLKQRRK